MKVEIVLKIYELLRRQQHLAVLLYVISLLPGTYIYVYTCTYMHIIYTYNIFIYILYWYIYIILNLIYFTLYHGTCK